jgi:hypothetical protein
MTHKMGRKAKRLTMSYETLTQLVSYDPDTGEMSTIGPYGTSGVRMKDGHLHIAVPISPLHIERGSRTTEYYRADYIAWFMVTGEWPDGWMEHVNGVRMDIRLDNLVHCDASGVRWWYGRQREDMTRCLVVVEAIGGLQADGPVTLRVTEGDHVVVKPKVNDRFKMAPLVPVDDGIREKDVLDKGEFGIDWGLPDDEPEPEDDPEDDAS